MAIVNRESGCKVGWATYDNEAEALAAVPGIVEAAHRAAARGYDFGYQCPGEVQATTHDGKPAWRVTTS